MFKVRPWLLVAFLCVLSAAGASGATRKLLEAKYNVLLQVVAMARCAPAPVATKTEQMKLPAMEVHADPKPDPSQMPTSVTEAALVALAKAYNDHPHYYEYAGVIVAVGNGKFDPSMPRTDGHAADVDIDEDPETYDARFPVVADYHTHPCLQGYVPGVFSPADLHSMRSLNRPGYILDECTGDVHYWAPGMGYDPQDIMDKIEGIHLASGQVVGHIPVDGKSILL